MKKMLICCGALCMTLLLFCGTAFAAVKVDKTDASVDVTANDAGTEVKVVKNDVKAEDNYLVMIQKGAATDKPTEKNLYYLDVTKPDGTKFEKTAYPKTMEEGTYVVFLSDWSDAGKGARKAVATLTVGGDNPDPNPNPNPDPVNGDILYGDVDGNGKVKSWDATVLACYLAGQADFQNINEKNADCDANGKVRSWDLTILYCYLAGQSDFAQLPHTGN